MKTLVKKCDKTNEIISQYHYSIIIILTKNLCVLVCRRYRTKSLYRLPIMLACNCNLLKYWSYPESNANH